MVVVVVVVGCLWVCVGGLDAAYSEQFLIDSASRAESVFVYALCCARVCACVWAPFLGDPSVLRVHPFVAIWRIRG